MFPPHQDPPVILDNSLSFFFNQLPKDFRLGNPERQFWKTWQSWISLYSFKCTSEKYRHEQCWGWTIIRTSYEDDEKFNRAISAIHRLALVRLEDEYRESRTRGRPDNSDVETVDQRIAGIPGHPRLRERMRTSWRAMVESAREALPAGQPLTPDWVITSELARRYHNRIVQDREALEGADASGAWRYARSLNIEEEEVGARGALFVYLDKEYLLAQAPSQENLANMGPDDRGRTAWLSWVKVVSTACEVTEDGDDTDEMMRYPLARRRLRLYDFFDVFIRLCEGSLDEMGVEGQGRRGFVRREERDWEFCRHPGPTGKRGKWLHELYGEEEERGS